MGRRYRSPRLAKRHRCYTVEQTARLYECHKNTVRAWLKGDLEPIDGRRPILIKGSALNAFHAKRRESACRRCGPGELYCLPCRKPQRPAGDTAEYSPITSKVGVIRAICPCCGRSMFQRVNAARLAVFRKLLDLIDAKGSPRMREMGEAIPNCDFEEQGLTR